MARKKVSPLLTFGLIGITALVLGAGGIYFSQFAGGGTGHDAQMLDAAAYVENANSLNGNVYRLDATIQNSLASDWGSGRFVSVKLNDASNTKVAVFVPATLAQINLQKGQRYQIVVAVVDHGLLKAKSLEKN